MKIILLLSLILNGVLLYLYLGEKKQPPIERIIMEKHVERAPKHRETVTEPKPSGNFTKTVTTEKKHSEEDLYAPFIGDQAAFERSADDMEMVKKDFLEKNEMSENFEQKKSQIMGKYYEKSSLIYNKHPSGMTISFEEKRKLIDMEQEAHQEIEKLFGKDKWSKYKNFVDSYNKKLIEGYKNGDYTGPLMGY